MIARQHRFHGHGSLNFVYKKGRSVRGGNLTLRYSPAYKRDDYRMAIVVSRKVSKSAVVRNSIRRRIYEIVRTYKKEDDQAWPFDLVITVFDDSTTKMTPVELRQQVIGILQKAVFKHMA